MVLIMTTMTIVKYVNDNYDICQVCWLHMSKSFDHGCSSNDSLWWHSIKEETYQVSSVKDIKFNARKKI